jgi:hypothetical protein
MRSDLLKDFLFVRAISFDDYGCPSCGSPACVGRWDDGRDGNDGDDVIYCGNPDCPVGIIWKWERSHLAN